MTDKYTILESYVEEIQMGKVFSTIGNKVEDSGRALVDAFLAKVGPMVLNAEDAAKLKAKIDEIPMYGTLAILLAVAAVVARKYYMNSYGQFVKKCGEESDPSPEVMKLCILKARLNGRNESIKLLRYAQSQCSKIKDSSKCRARFNERIKKEQNHIREIQVHMAGRLAGKKR